MCRIWEYDEEEMVLKGVVSIAANGWKNRSLDGRKEQKSWISCGKYLQRLGAGRGGMGSRKPGGLFCAFVNTLNSFFFFFPLIILKARLWSRLIISGCFVFFFFFLRMMGDEVSANPYEVRCPNWAVFFHNVGVKQGQNFYFSLELGLQNVFVLRINIFCSWGFFLHISMS